ncbi:MAG TPA: hypothetical protein O0Y05_00145 [Methanocorpusculum sp.]|nr:hypothetical protein [Methanocorpusculum sp.]
MLYAVTSDFPSESVSDKISNGGGDNIMRIPTLHFIVNLDKSIDAQGFQGIQKVDTHTRIEHNEQETG